MSSSPGDSTTSQSHGSSTSSDSACFECNICFDLAQDPIVTLCGHLFCWPCLYKWLHVHSHSPECPVCKAIIEEEKLVPLYGRGKTSSDPRSRSMPDEDIHIPHRPTGQRPETASQANLNQILQPQGFGIMGGFPPMATARWGNFMFSTGFGGLFPSLFNFHVHGFRGAAGYGPRPSFPYTFHGGHAHGFPHQHHHHHHHQNALGQQADSNLAMLFAIVGVLVIVALLWF